MDERKRIDGTVLPDVWIYTRSHILPLQIKNIATSLVTIKVYHKILKRKMAYYWLSEASIESKRQNNCTAVFKFIVLISKCVVPHALR